MCDDRYGALVTLKAGAGHEETPNEEENVLVEELWKEAMEEKGFSLGLGGFLDFESWPRRAGENRAWDHVRLAENEGRESEENV